MRTGLAFLVPVTLLLSACAGTPTPDSAPRDEAAPDAWSLPDGPPGDDGIDVHAIPDAVPGPEPRAERGNPLFYEVFGQRYYVRDSAEGYVDRGIASWYGSRFHGRKTSSGEPYDMYAMTAAHRELPLPTYARVTNLENGSSVVVRINDRGPFANNRLIDLSYAAAARLGIVEDGTGLVEVVALDPRATDSAEPAGAQAAGRPRLYLQLGAFSQRENAERVVARLRDASIYNVQLITRTDEAPGLWRVRIGPMTDVEDVDDTHSTVTGLGFGEARIIIEQERQ